MTQDLADRVARVAMAIQKAGDDHLGTVESVHQTFMDILRELMRARADVTQLRECLLEACRIAGESELGDGYAATLKAFRVIAKGTGNGDV